MKHIRNQNAKKEATGPDISNTGDQTTAQSRNLSQLERAKCIVEEERISFDPNLHTFTVIGSEGRPQVVKLFPKQSCTCPSTSTCYHILAAQLSVGLEKADNSKQRLNLTQLRRNARVRKEKRSGRKCPRPGDYIVEPAPNAKSDTAELLSKIQNDPTHDQEVLKSQKESNRHPSKKRCSLT